jgi:hypothetical protein
VNGTAEAVADTGGDAALVAVDTNVWREQNQKRDSQSSAGEIKQATKSTRGAVLCFDGVVCLLVGGIGLLHEDGPACSSLMQRFLVMEEIQPLF